MHESTQDTHGDIQHMSDDYDKYEPHPANTAVTQSLHTDGVEGLAELGSRQTQGIQTQITQHITEQARGRVVGLPQTRTEIKQGIAVQVICFELYKKCIYSM